VGLKNIDNISLSICCLLKLKKLRLRNCLNDLIEFAFTGCGGLLKPIQIHSELTNLLSILDRIKPKYILEIGTANGGTLFLFSCIASQDARIISIDLPGGEFGGGYPLWKVPLYKSFALADQKIHLIRADSHDKKTLEKVLFLLDGKQIDFLFIDGDYSYEGVKKDCDLYSSMVRHNGFIGFHDIVANPEDMRCGVDKFWSEIKDKYEYIEIMADGGRNRCYGIGVLTK
jgi:predicted O-methyltransferase YrrM